MRACAAESAKVVIVDRDAEHGEKLQAEFSSGGNCSLVLADLGAEESCSQAVEQAVGNFGKLDALVNNAGVNDKVGLEHGNPNDYLGSLQRNLVHYYSMAHLCPAAFEGLKRVDCKYRFEDGVTGQGGTSGYASSKGAIMALTREWAVELLPYGIRVNPVVPAEVTTPLYKQWLNTFPDPDEKLRTITSKSPLEKRMTTAEEVAATTVFLISSRSSHTTGQQLFVDGGYVHLDRGST